MKVKFLKDVSISGNININNGDVFEAKCDGDFIMIRMADYSTVKAPKTEAGCILEIIND